MSLCGKEGPGSRRFGRSLIPVTDGRSRRIVLKNSNFCIDHNTGTAGGLDEKFLRGFGGPTGFAACDAPICPAVRTIGGDDATRAKTRFSRWLNFRVFQQYPSTPAVRCAQIADLSAASICRGSTALSRRMEPFRLPFLPL